MDNFNIKVDLSSIKNFPQAKKVIGEELKKFFVRVLAKYDKTIKTNPWRIGMSGGGSPVKTGKLRDSHTKDFTDYTAKISTRTEYAEKVHNGRPWLEYAMTENEGEFNNLLKGMLETITNTV